VRQRLARIGLIALLAVPVGGAMACDKEDVKDVEEVGNDIEQEVDNADTDGKDD
jgi:hypothetical protein